MRGAGAFLAAMTETSGAAAGATQNGPQRGGHAGQQRSPIGHFDVTSSSSLLLFRRCFCYFCCCLLFVVVVVVVVVVAFL